MPERPSRSPERPRKRRPGRLRTVGWVLSVFLLVAVVCNDYSAVAFAAGTGLLIRGWHWLALLLFLVGCYLCRSDLIPLAFAALVLFLAVALLGRA